MMNWMQVLTCATLAVVSTAFTPVALPHRQHHASALQMTAEEAETKDVIKVGVIGMGRIGLVHLEAITKAPGVTPVIVSNPTVSKAEAGK